MVGLMGSACHRRLPGMLEAGRVDEVIARAESSRFAPRRKAARAYAEALVRRGSVDQARSVLLVDFRKGGHLESLVALADLELRLGLDGVAALHYARAAGLDHACVAGREDVCALLRQRARDLLRFGEALAAEEDLLLARRICHATRPTTALEDDALAHAIDQAAGEQVRARSATTCPPSGCDAAPDSDPAAAVAAALDQARTEGPRALRSAADRLQTQLDPGDIVALLLAEAKGELGLDLLPDHEVRGWVGSQRWSELASVITSHRAAETAWLQLRLSAVIDDVPKPPSARVGPTIRERWADRALELSGAARWRISAYIGDLAGAELALAAEFRPRPEAAQDVGAPPLQDAPADADSTFDLEVAVPSHWAARVEPSSRSLEGLVVLARLREAAGQDDKGLEIVRFVLARAHAAGLETAPTVTLREAARHLGRGQPWHALAVADSLPLEALTPTRAAAASAIALSHVFCGGTCPDDPDRAAVQRVLGESWVDTMMKSLPQLARGDQTRPSADARCPTLGERLGPDAIGPVTEALQRAAQSLEGPGLGDLLRRAIGSDPILACGARHVLPLMVAANARLSAAALSDLLAHAPRMRAEPMLRTHAELALVGGQEARTELLAVAAAGASRDAADTWAAIARRAHSVDAREVERMALRELIMHTPNLDHEPARRALVISALRDLTRAKMVRESQVGREAVQAQVADYLDGYAPSQRWARQEALARQVGRAPWAKDHRSLLVEALMPTPAVQGSHPLGLAWLTGASVAHTQPFDGAGLELDRARGRARPLPVVVDVFAELVAFEDARLELAARARDWTVRRRAAIGLAVYGSAPARASAVGILARMIGDDERRLAALHEWLLARPAALEPDSMGPRATVVVHDEEALLRVIFGLDSSDAWFPEQ
jgi:hypothetical protein